MTTGRRTGTSPRPGLARRLARATPLAVGSYGRHQNAQHAAAIAFRALFALVPLAALAVSLAELVLPEQQDAELREWLGRLAPGDELEGSLTRALEQTSTSASLAGLAALVGLFWTASGLGFALRSALRVIWEEPSAQPFLRGKLADLIVVVGGVALLLAAFVASVVLQVVASAGAAFARSVGLPDDDGLLGFAAQTLVSLALGVVALLLVFRVLAPSPRPFSQLLPGALVGATLAQLVTLGFSTYLAFVDVDELYGALGGIFALLLLAYYIAHCVVFGAEVTAAWPAAAEDDSGIRLPRRVPSLRRRRAASHDAARDRRL